MKFPEHGYIEDDGVTCFYWKASTLWKLAETMPVEDVPLDSFDWTNDNFSVPVPKDRPFLWRDVGDHTRRILNTDLKHPIIISGEGHVMDGMHRILKCYAFGVPSVKAVRFKTTPPPDHTYPLHEIED